VDVSDLSALQTAERCDGLLAPEQWILVRDVFLSGSLDENHGLHQSPVSRRRLQRPYPDAIKPCNIRLLVLFRGQPEHLQSLTLAQFL
jgi:hypothetical protein